MSQVQPQGKALDISIDNIEISHNKNPADSKSILQENKAIKKQNQALKKQLQNLSTRLDVEIIKRITIQKKKQNSEVSQMQLQNAYKKYEIYKKQASLYRRKYQQLNDDSKFDDFQKRIISYSKENYDLKEEVRQLKKVIKQQQKGLAEIGIEGYPMIVSQNQKLKEEVRILKKQVDNYRRSFELNKKIKTNNSHYDDKINDSAEQHMISLPLKKKEKVRDKLKNNLKTQEGKNSDYWDFSDLLREKTEKNLHIMKSLAGEKQKLRELVQNLKLQLAQKEKENVYLKEKINQLRRNNELLQSQAVIKRPIQIVTTSKAKRNKTRDKRVNSELSQISNPKLKTSKATDMPKIRVWKKSKNIEPEVIQNIRNTKFPQKVQNKHVSNNVIKWSHQHLTSKIKQLQILQHQKGHIKYLHVKYQKGQPKKYHQSGANLKYKLFTCSKDQFIKNVEGAFFEGYLQYLVVTSSHNRVEKYGNFLQFQQPSQGEHFQFQVGEGQFPGALFGQNDEYGVKKLGCFIHRQN